MQRAANGVHMLIQKCVISLTTVITERYKEATDISRHRSHARMQAETEFGN